MHPAFPGDEDGLRPERKISTSSLYCPAYCIGNDTFIGLIAVGGERIRAKG
jgi:hypothetical protein